MCSTCSWATKTTSEQRRAWRAGRSCSVQGRSAHIRHNSCSVTPHGDAHPAVFHTSPMPNLTSHHSHGRTFLQGSLEGLKPEDLLQCFPDPALQARGSLPAHPKDAANSDRNLSWARTLPPSSPLPEACPDPLHDLPQGCPATLPLFPGLSGMLIQTPSLERATMFTVAQPPPHGAQQRGLMAGESQCPPTPHAEGCGGRRLLLTHPPSSPWARVLARPVSPVPPPPCPGPHPPRSLHTRQVLTRRHKMTSNASVKEAARALFIPSPPPRLSAPPR